MIAWIVRVLLAAAASVTQWFVAPTAPNFGVLQGLISLGIFAAVVFVLALWPGRGWVEVTDMRSARRETLRDFFTAVSILIASASAVFTGMQLRKARNAVLVQLKPHVDFDIEDDPDVPAIIGISIVNAGPGPALFKSVGYFVDGVRVKDADAVAAAARLPRVQLEERDFDPGDSLASMRRSGCPQAAWRLCHSAFDTCAW